VIATIQELLLLSALIALGFLLAVAFYESLSTRDVLVRRAMRLAHRWSSQRWVIGLVYVATVTVGVPLLVLLWTIVLEAALIVVGSVERLGNLAVVAVAVVGAARILAYVREKTSHELAKAIPLALAFVFLTGGAGNLVDNLTRLLKEPDRSELTPQMVAFLVVLEIGLRIVTDTSHVLLSSIRERRGIGGDVGAWRTLLAATRRPPAPSVTAPAGPESGSGRDPQAAPGGGVTDDHPDV
jgi:hypothetical protein